MKNKNPIIKDRDLRVAIREYLILAQSELDKDNKALSEGVVSTVLDPKNWLKGLDMMVELIKKDDPTRIKFFKKLEKAPGWTDLAGIARFLGYNTQEYILGFLKFVASPVSLGFRKYFSGNPGSKVEELTNLFGKGFKGIDDILKNPGDHTWRSIIGQPGQAGSRWKAWQDAGLLKIKPSGQFTVEIIDSATGALRTVPMSRLIPGVGDASTDWAYLVVNGQDIPLPLRFGVPNPDAAIWRGARLKSGANYVHDLSNLESIADWQRAHNISDLGDGLKITSKSGDLKSLKELDSIVPSKFRYLIQYLYWGQAVPFEMAVWSTIVGMSGSDWLFSEVVELMNGDSKIDEMFSSKVYEKTIGAGLALTDSDTSGVTGLSTGGGLWYVNADRDIKVDNYEDMLKLESAYNLILSLDDAAFSGAFENVRTLVNMFQGKPLGGDDVVSAAELDVALMTIDEKSTELGSLLEDSERLKNAWAAIKTISNVTTADFSYCFDKAFQEGRASYGTRHFMGWLFGERGILKGKKASDFFGFEDPRMKAIIDFGGLAGLAIGAGISSIDAARTDAQLTATERVEKEDEARRLSAERQKIAKAADKQIADAGNLIRSFDDIGDIIKEVYSQIKELPVAYAWDITNPDLPSPKVSKEINVSTLKKIVNVTSGKDGSGNLGDVLGQSFVQVFSGISVPDNFDQGASAPSGMASPDLDLDDEASRKDIETDTSSGAGSIESEVPAAATFTQMAARGAGAGADLMETIEDIQIGERESPTFNPTQNNKNWPSRLASGDTAVGDDFVGYTAQQIADGNFKFPNPADTEQTLEKDRKMLLATFAKISLVFNIDPGELSNKINAAINKIGAAYPALQSQVGPAEAKRQSRENAVAAIAVICKAEMMKRN